jgi:hypothetical protein
VDVHYPRGQRLKIEMGTGKIDGLGEIVPCVRKGSVEVKHDQINLFFHPIRLKLKTPSKSTRSLKDSLLSIARMLYLGVFHRSSLGR